MIPPTQPAPKPGRDVVLFHVLDALMRRAEKGMETYGTLLQTENGRDPLQDALEEVLDAAMYLQQAILERNQQQVANERLEEIAK